MDIKLTTPVNKDDIKQLKIYDQIEISGKIFTGRDAALPKLVKCFQDNSLHQLGINLEGSVIFHTAVSPAGIGPTTSNKHDIESSIPELSRAGVRIHLGKGALSRETIAALHEHNSIFAITPPVGALFASHIFHKEVVAFAEEGMEALHLITVKKIPAIVAIAHGKSLFR